MKLVLKPGSEVKLWNDVPAKIIAVMIETYEKVSYRVAYWNGQRLEHEWIDDSLIPLSENSVLNHPHQRIGYY